VVGGWVLGRQALAAAGFDDPWLKFEGRAGAALRQQVLALAPGLADAVCEPSAIWRERPPPPLAG
jgi:hypothetical protein